MFTRVAAPSLTQRYSRVRQFSEMLCRPLVTEDYVIQTMPDVSPTKWHLAHTTWFFETFILKKYKPNYREYHPRYSYIFNSYYNAVGDRHCRARRGQLSRPTVKEIYQYREAIDEQMTAFMDFVDPEGKDLASLIELGLHHEQQHQELMVTDIKHVFACSPLHPVYSKQPLPQVSGVPEMTFQSFEGGVYRIGNSGEGFGYDNEFPEHLKHVRSFKIGSRLVTNGEFLQFITDGGYEKPEFWLSDGWAEVQKQKWRAPLYWDKEDGRWFHFTLNGFIPVNGYAPVCHISFFEADAFARWAGKRLSSEEEWEVAAAHQEAIEGNFVESGFFAPVPLQEIRPLAQMFGDVWEWTASPYVGYPGYKPAAGAVGEYNGKFMSNQMVLRGGSCATAFSHIRPTYRNFFYPYQRWQFSGIRLAEDV